MDRPLPGSATIHLARTDGPGYGWGMSYTNDDENAVIDGKVLEKVRAGVGRAGLIEIALKLEMRAVDKSLQRLRRAGKIRFTAKRRWEAT